ncbi:uncharacterized protein LOC141611767 [Silene latifolia]|uniref:uncharacterized protein LOC141611767 n=1 Tax=Silene latifolia TaxID=37657 RepID=UPI003D78001A
MSTFNSSTTTTPNFDNLLLDSLLNRLKIRPPQPPPSTTTTTANDHPLLSSSFEEFLAAHLSDSSFEDSFSDDDYDDFNHYGDDDNDDDDGTVKRTSSRLSKEESRLEKQIVKVILNGNIQTLKPNSGQAVSIGDHHVCVGFHEEEGGSGYRVWEWHGHIMLFDDDHGYTPEYIYGNYFERLVAGRKVDSKKREEEKGKDEKKVDNNTCNLGLRELIDNAAQGPGETRVLHCGRNAALSRVLEGASEA